MLRTSCFFIMLMLMLCPLCPADADEIVLAADDWCPYNCFGSKELPGYVVEMTSLIFAEAGHRVTYREMPWTRAVMDAEKGKVDGVICATRDEVPAFIFTEEPVGTDANDFIVRRGDSWRYRSLSDIEDVRIGVVQDYDYGNLEAHIKKYAGTDKVQTVSGRDAEEKNLRKLMKNRIDVVVGDIKVFRMTARRMGLQDEIEYAGTDGDYAKLYIAFSPVNPKSAEYAAILSSGIDKLRKSGRLATILAKYEVPDWK